MSDTIYTPTTWKDYPDTSTPITAAELNRIEDRITRVPKETGTFLLQAVFGGLKWEKTFGFITTRGVEILSENYNPSNGDKLVVWKNNSVPCYEGVDYIVTPDGDNYILKATEAIGAVVNAHIQIWNIPTSNTTPTTGTAYTSIGSLITDSIIGTIEEDNDE